jgi:signal transduction histidine kinase
MAGISSKNVLGIALDVIDAVPMAIAEIDPAGAVRFANQRWTEWFGGGRRKLVGRPLDDEVAGGFRAAIDRALAGESVVAENAVQSRQLRATCVPRRDEGGAVAGVVVLLADLTEERRCLAAERALALATEALFATLDPESALQAVADRAVGVLGDWINIELVRDDGRLEQVAVAHRDPDRLAIAGQIRRCHPPHAGLLRVARTGQAEVSAPIDLEERAVDDVHLELLRRMDIASSLIAPIGAHDAIFGAIELVRGPGSPPYRASDARLVEELGRRIALAIENARMFELTRRAVAAREQLLALVCHDLRDPLSVIQVRSGLLRERFRQIGNPEGLSVDAIDKATRRMDALVTTLADAARLRAGELTMHPQPCDLVALARDAVDEHNDAALRKGVCLALVLDLGHAMAMVDPQRMLQVLSNLLSNAIKLTPAGGRVELRLGGGPSEIDIAVVDTGPGIAAEEMARIFDRTWQVEPGQQQSFGLGLYIARGIVQAHRGRIWVESQPGRGASFRISIPTSGDRVTAGPQQESRG